MAFSNALGNALPALLFNGTALPSNYTGTSYFLSIHLGDTGLGGTQATSEISYTGYARKPLVRNTTGEWTVSGKTATNAIDVTFGLMTAGAGGLATHLGLGELVTGTGIILSCIPLTQSYNVQNGTQLHFPAGSIVFTFA